MRAAYLFIIFWIFPWTVLQAQDTLTVMSYNIYHAEQAYDEGKSSLRDIAALITTEDPDYVALQEVDERTQRLASLHEEKSFSLADSLANLADMTGYFGKAIDYEGGGYGIGLLSKEKAESQKVMLPMPADGEQRVLLFIETETKSEHPLIFGGTHLDHQSPENKMAQVEAINEYFSTREMPVLLGGDFNFIPGSEPYNQMEEQWIDAALMPGGEPEPTIPAEDPDRRIDYIFLSEDSKWELLNFRTISVQYSDHLPIVATVVLHPE